MPDHARAPVRLPEGWGLVCLPVGTDDWTAVVFGVEDDFKTPRDGGGTFGGQPIDTLPLRLGLDVDAVWPDAPGEDDSLWSACLWRAGDIDDVLSDALRLTGDAGALPAHWSSGSGSLIPRF